MKFLLMLSIFSCTKNNVKFTIENARTKPIDSIIISNGFDRSGIVHLGQGQEGKFTLNFSKNVNSDGSYCIEIYQNNSEKKQNFGYFSNGSPLEKEFRIKILNDTIDIASKLN